MTPEKRRPSAQEYRESLSPEMQEYWDSVTGRKTYQVPEKSVEEIETKKRPDHVRVFLSIMLLYWLYRCHDSFVTMKPGDEVSFVVLLIIFWLPIAAYFTWGIIKGDL